MSEIFVYDGVSIDKTVILPILNFHWPEPNFILENLSFDDICLWEIDLEKFMFEPIFPWVKKNSDNILIVNEAEQQLVDSK